MKKWILLNNDSYEYSEVFRDEDEDVLCIEDKDTVYSITDEFVFYDRDEANRVAQDIWDSLLPSLEMFDDLAADQPLVEVVAFRHGESDWSTAISMEWNVVVNKLGYGVVVRSDLLDRLKIPYFKHEASSVSSHIPEGDAK